MEQIKYLNKLSDENVSFLMYELGFRIKDYCSTYNRDKSRACFNFEGLTQINGKERYVEHNLQMTDYEVIGGSFRKNLTLALFMLKKFGTIYLHDFELYWRNPNRIDEFKYNLSCEGCSEKQIDEYIMSYLESINQLINNVKQLHSGSYDNKLNKS